MTTVRIIRAHDGAPPRRRLRPAATRVLRASHLDALAEADRMLRDAADQARTLVERAGREAETIRREADENSRSEAAAQLLAARERAHLLVAEARGKLTGLAVAIADKLLGEALRLAPQRIEQIVATCLQQASLQGSGRVVLRVNPGALGAVEQALPRLQRLVDAHLLVVEPDPDISPGGCLLDSELGQIDGRLETRLETIRQALESDG